MSVQISVWKHYFTQHSVGYWFVLFSTVTQPNLLLFDRQRRPVTIIVGAAAGPERSSRRRTQSGIAPLQGKWLECCHFSPLSVCALGEGGGLMQMCVGFYAGRCWFPHHCVGVSGERRGQTVAGSKHPSVNSQSRHINSLSASVSTVKWKKEKKKPCSF